MRFHLTNTEGKSRFRAGLSVRETYPERCVCCENQEHRAAPPHDRPSYNPERGQAFTSQVFGVEQENRKSFFFLMHQGTKMVVSLQRRLVSMMLLVMVGLDVLCTVQVIILCYSEQYRAWHRLHGCASGSGSIT
jgi:hypothetical protein